MNNAWPVDTPLIGDEILSSWIIRTAFDNGSYPLAWSWCLWGRRRIWTTDIDRCCPPKLLEVLVTQSVSFSALNRATLFPWLSNVAFQDLNALKHSWPWVNPLGARNRDRTGGLRYCPICLDTPPAYYRRHWRFSWQHSCAVHKCILKDRCPKCSGPVCPHKLKQGSTNIAACSICGFDLRKTSVNGSTENSLKLQTLMNQLLEGEFTGELPWGITNSPELFKTVRYLVGWLNRAYVDQLSADKYVFQLFGIEAVPCSDSHATVERTSIERMQIWFEKIYAMFTYNLSEFAEILVVAGYTQRSFLSRISLAISPQIALLLDCLPIGPVKKREKIHTNNYESQPTLRSTVEDMWNELLTFLR